MRSMTKMFLLLVAVLLAGCAAAPQAARSQTPSAAPASAPSASPAQPPRAQGGTAGDADATSATFTFNINERLPAYVFELMGRAGQKPDAATIERIIVRRA